MTDLFILSREVDRRPAAGDRHRPGAGRRQCGRHRAGGGRAGQGAARARDPGRHPRRHCACASLFAVVRHSAAGHRRPAARRRHPAAVGVLEDVARIARAVARQNRGGADGGRCARAAQDLRAGRLADRDGRHLDVARQRAGGGGRRARPPGRAGVRAGPVDRADGRRRQLHRPPAQPAPLDRLCRAGDHSLRRLRHDLARRGGSAAARRWAA